jgi:hypothetical protein
MVARLTPMFDVWVSFKKIATKRNERDYLIFFLFCFKWDKNKISANNTKF